MPVDPPQSFQAWRSSRKAPIDDEIDLRRARGEISCAECRRLKLKCDKKLPCGSCVRRGCPSICPNGCLSTGQGTRFVLADTVHLHEKITEMGQRIRQLEDALAIFQSGVSNETHPLLTDDLLAIKFGPEKGQVQEMSSIPSRPMLDSIDAIGTMTISDQGDGSTGKYFGPSAGSEASPVSSKLVCMLPVPPAQATKIGAETEEPGQKEEDSAVSADLAKLSTSLAPVSDGIEANLGKALDLLYSYLPPQPRAWALCETYLEQAAFTARPIQRDEIINEILAPTYRALKAKEAGESLEAHSVSPHKLAILYLIFALGTIVDLTLESYAKEAEMYYRVSRACIACRSILDSPELATVQAIILTATYHSMTGEHYAMDSTWTLTCLGAKLGQSLGLHRDSARWNMDVKTVQRRRHVFWETAAADFFYSLALGRPPSIRLSYVDCELPQDHEATVDNDGKVLVGYHRWKYEFIKDIVSTILEQTLTAEAPQYRTILELDRKIREKVLPPHLNIFMSPEEERFTPSVYMRSCTLGQIRAVTLLYIHRSWFAQAMLDYPANPLRSPYAPSFLAAYRCASGVIKSCWNHFDRFPELCCRWLALWTQLLSAAIIVGSIVTRSPSSSMAPTAFIELGLACDMFAKGANHSRRIRSGSAILQRLRQKALHVYPQFRSGNPPPRSDLVFNKPDHGDELALFGGQTRVLVTSLLSVNAKKHSMSSGSSMSSPNPDSESLRGSSVPMNGNLPEVHPSLVEYLSAQSALPRPPSHTTSPLMPTDTPHGGPAISTHEDAPSIFTNTWSNWQQNPSPQGQNLPLHNGPPHSGFPYVAASSASQSSGFDILGSGIQADTPENDQLMDMGMIASGESRMDEQWISFMRESGLVDFTYSQDHTDTTHTLNAYSLGNRTPSQDAPNAFW